MWDIYAAGVLPDECEPPTWGSLLGLHSTSIDSPEFQLAMHKLEVLAKTELGDFRGSELEWTCEFPVSEIQGYQMIDESKASKLTSLLGLGLPAVAQQFVKQSENSVVHVQKRPRLDGTASVVACSPTALCEDLVAREVKFAESRGFTEAIAALARTSTGTLSLFLAGVDEGEDSEVDSGAVVANGGFALTALLHGRLICQLAEEYRLATTFAKSNSCDIVCSSLSNGVFAAICSAFTGLPPDKQLNSLQVDSVSRRRWGWVVYTLCCRCPAAGLQVLFVNDATVTQADVVAMRKALKNGYPSSSGSQEYGFASIPQGARLFSTRTPRTETTAFFAVEALVCRARRSCTTALHYVEAVVPGYGTCLTTLGDTGAHFTRDFSGLTTPSIRNQSCLLSLKLRLVGLELDSLVVDVLTIIGGNLRKLSVKLDDPDIEHEYDIARVADIDLCAVAAACPKLEVLELVLFDLVVSSPSDTALYKWPIKKINVLGCLNLPNLAPYLSNPTARMARGLMELKFSALDVEEFGETVRNLLEAHDGDILPITKEKFPTDAKIAMLSIVGGSRAAGDREVVYHLDVDTLSIIFTFAATPVQRSVRCGGYHGHFSDRDLFAVRITDDWGRFLVVIERHSRYIRRFSPRADDIKRHSHNIIQHLV